MRRKHRPLVSIRLVADMAGLVALWLQRGRSRRQLSLLLADSHVLSDLGLTPEQVEHEAIKPFWR
ncbi:MAG TPA: hypothetical protein VKQ29_18510 [Aliidongia sp.]|nr:hypothetical protein [Aliidongia sp.]